MGRMHFSFEVLESMEQGETQGAREFREDVKALEELWKEKLAAAAESSPNRKRPLESILQRPYAFQMVVLSFIALLVLYVRTDRRQKIPEG